MNCRCRWIALVSALVIFSTIAPVSPVRGGTDRKVRIPVDSIGYAITAAQVEAVVAYADSRLDSDGTYLAARSGAGTEPVIGGICPHDDYLYAGLQYVQVLREIRAPLLVLVGVAHRARRIGLEQRLIFDDFEAWRGPYGECPVSPVRGEIIGRLPDDLVLVDGPFHAGEHSLEAFIPFIQYYSRGDGRKAEGAKRVGRAVEILPVLVTRLNGTEMGDAAGALADALHAVMDRDGLRLGEDVAVLISADCVHYGDEKWGGRGYAPFGTDRAGYDRAVEQDISIVRDALTNKVLPSDITLFRERIERDDLEWPYKVTWCGVYSIPFGLHLLSRLREHAGGGPPEGIMLGYATSVSPGKIPLDRTGLGVTNINTLRHWVGYTAVVYR